MNFADNLEVPQVLPWGPAEVHLCGVVDVC